MLGADGVVGLRTSATELVGDGTVRGTGTFTGVATTSVYCAAGYRSSHPGPAA